MHVFVVDIISMLALHTRITDLPKKSTNSPLYVLPCLPFKQRSWHDHELYNVSALALSRTHTAVKNTFSRNKNVLWEILFAVCVAGKKNVSQLFSETCFANQTMLDFKNKFNFSCFAAMCFAAMCFASMCFAAMCFAAMCFAAMCFAAMCFAVCVAY